MGFEAGTLIRSPDSDIRYQIMDLWRVMELEIPGTCVVAWQVRLNWL